MRQLKKEEAIQEYGVKYVPALDRLDLGDLHPEFPRDPRDALAKKLETLTKPRFDATLRVIEELGSATEDFHFRDLQDVQQRYEAEQRAYYKETLGTLDGLMADPVNVALLEQAAASAAPEEQRLKSAFEKASAKRAQLRDILDSGLPFKIDVKLLKNEVTLPDILVEPGATVYVVKSDGKSIPSIASGTVVSRDMQSAFLSKIDYIASYQIDTGAPDTDKTARDEKIFLSPGESGTKTPAGAVARGLNKVAFNSKAAAIAYIGDALDAKETELKAELKQLRAVRKQLGNGR